jgi:hypothetical protein
MVQGRGIAAALLIAVALSIAAATTAPALSVPTTPTVTTPTLTVPPVNPPVSTTPIVTVPKVTPPKATPPISIPPSAGTPPRATVPSVSVPKVTTPKVAVPPKGSSPSPSGGGGGSTGGGGGGGGGGSSTGLVNTVKRALPAAPVGGLVGTPSKGSGARTGSAGAGGTGTPSPSGSGDSTVAPIFGAAPGGPGGGLAGPGGFTGPGGPGGLSGGGPGSPAAFAFRLPPTAPGTGGVSAFAAAVGALAGCFYTLTPYEQQVLTVRSGLDGRQPLTRAQAAGLLGISPTAVGRTERTALSELNQAARSDGCMAVGASSPANALTAFIGGPFGPVGFVTPALAPVTRTAPGASQPPNTKLTSTSFADQLARLDDGAGAQASISILVILAVMLSAALAALLLEARRSVH